MAKELTDIQSFLTRLERQFEDPPALTPETLFRNLPGWTSLQSLVVVIGFDEDYGITISSDELEKTQTMQDLYQLVKDKKAV